MRGVVDVEQGRFAFAAFGEIHHVDDNGADILVHPLLRAEGGVPGPAALGAPGEVVAEEEGDRAPVRVGHLEGPHVRVVHRNVMALGEGEAEQAVRRVEGGRDDIVERKMRPHVRFLESEARAAQLFGIKSPIVPGEGEISAFGCDHRVEVAFLGLGACTGFGPHLVQKVSHGAGASWPWYRRGL